MVMQEHLSVCVTVCVLLFLKKCWFFLSSKSKICINADTINLYLLLLTTSFMISSSLLFDDSFGRSNTSGAGGWEADGSWSLAVDWPDWEPALLLLLPVLLVVVDIFTESATVWRCWCHDSASESLTVVCSWQNLNLLCSVLHCCWQCVTHHLHKGWIYHRLIQNMNYVKLISWSVCPKVKHTNF